MDPIFFPGTMVTKDLDPWVENPSFPSKALLLNGPEALKLRTKDMGRSSLASIQRSLTHCTDWWLLTYLDLNFSIAPWNTPNQPLWEKKYLWISSLWALCHVGRHLYNKEFRLAICRWHYYQNHISQRILFGSHFQDPCPTHHTNIQEHVFHWVCVFLFILITVCPTDSPEVLLLQGSSHSKNVRKTQASCLLSRSLTKDCIIPWLSSFQKYFYKVATQTD